MTAFLAIVKLTCRSAFRSNIFRVLLFVLLLAVVLVPNTIRGDGTTQGFLQVILEYSLGFVAFILFASSIWVSCAELCIDVETGQLQMIVVKPISRITVWFGKFCGVLLIHTVLLIVSAIAVAGFLTYQFSRQDFNDQGKEEVSLNKLFPGRRVFMPEQPNYDAMAEAEIRKRTADLQARGELVPGQVLDDSVREQIRKIIYEEVKSNYGEVGPGQDKFWRYTNLPTDYTGQVTLRYKPMTNAFNSYEQGVAELMWIVGKLTKPSEEGAPGVAYGEYYPPVEVLCGALNEMEFGSDIIRSDGTVELVVINDAEKYQRTIYFQAADGPKLLIDNTGFWGNYTRVVVVIFLGLFSVTVISCGIGALFGMPTAIFLSISYIVISVASRAMLNTFGSFDLAQLDLVSAFGTMWSRLLVKVLIPLQDFFVSGKLASGELIEYSMIGELLYENIIFRGIPFIVLGVFFYRRKELAIAVKR